MILKEFIGIKSFSMITTVSLIQYIMDTVDNAELFLTRYERFGSRISLRQGNDSMPASIAPAADIWELQFPNIDMLKPVLGEEYWWAATGEQFSFGSTYQRVHNFIKPIDSDITFRFDTISNHLNVSYRCIHGDRNGAINDIKNALQFEQQRLVGKRLGLENNQYYILAVEMNSTDFTQQRSKGSKRVKNTTTMVAWVVSEGTLLI